MSALTARTMASDVGRTEGPVIRPNGEILFVSINHGVIYRMQGERAIVFAQTDGGPNGLAEGQDGTLYVAQSSGRHRPGHPASVGSTAKALDTGGIQAVDSSGNVTWVTQDPIAPNDLCFGPDGFLYLTDPTRGREARDDGRLWRCNVETGEAELLCSVPWFPNGIGFGIDDALYVASSGESRVVRFSLDRGRLGKEETFFQLPRGESPDGFAFDTEGNLISGCVCFVEGPGQVVVFDRNGKQIDKFLPGSSSKQYTNVALGPDRVLIIADTQGGKILAVDNWPYPGLPLYPFRNAVAATSL